MLPRHLKLRSDLVITQQETRAGTYFVLKDPATGRFFRFREAEHFVAQQLDGSTSLDVIRQKVNEKFGLQVKDMGRPEDTIKNLGS